MARLWICPICGRGVRAPDRMRRDDTRRFCLACSAKSPRLVVRTCPALEKRRAAKQARRKMKAKKVKENRDGLPYALRDDLIHRDFVACQRLRCWPRDVSLAYLATIRRRSAQETTGFCSHLGRITITIGNHQDRDLVVRVLLHELSHYATPLPAPAHGDQWVSCYHEAMISALEQGLLQGTPPDTIDRYT